MMSIIMLAACLLGLFVLAALIVGIVGIMQSGRNDAISTARQGWLDSRRARDD